MKPLVWATLIALILTGCVRSDEENNTPPAPARQMPVTTMDRAVAHEGVTPKQVAMGIAANLYTLPMVTVGETGLLNPDGTPSASGNELEASYASGPWCRWASCGTRMGDGITKLPPLPTSTIDEGRLGIATVDRLNVLFFSARFDELIGYIRLADLVDPGLGIAQIRTGVEQEEDLQECIRNKDHFVYPFIVTEVDQTPCLFAVCGGFFCHPDAEFSSELLELAVAMPIGAPQGTLVDIDRVGIGIFRMLEVLESVESTSQPSYRVEMLSYTLLTAPDGDAGELEKP